MFGVHIASPSGGERLDSSFGDPSATGGDAGSTGGAKPGGGQWSHPGSEGHDHPAAAGPSGASALPSGGLVVGSARDVQTRADTDWFTKSQHSVLAFRVESFDESGNLELLVPVEMRGLAFEGFLNEGDPVRVTGRLKRGILQAKKVENLRDDSMLTAKGLPPVAKVLAVALLVVIAAFIAFVVFQLMTSEAPPRFAPP
jgi:hypothetical protein